MCSNKVIQQFQCYSEERFDLLIAGRTVKRTLEKVFSFSSNRIYKPPAST